MLLYNIPKAERQDDKHAIECLMVNQSIHPTAKKVHESQPKCYDYHILSKLGQIMMIFNVRKPCRHSLLPRSLVISLCLLFFLNESINQRGYNESIVGS